MSDKILTVYHTTAKQNEENILKSGFYPSNRKGLWLGKGIYFYKDIYFAVQWGFIGVMKSNINNIEEFNDNCTILSADLNCENYQVLDLNTPDGRKAFIELQELIKGHYPKDRYEKICMAGDAYLFYILEILEQKLNKKILAQYDIICAEYGYNKVYPKQRTSKSDFAGCMERQLCVKNPDAIISISTINSLDESVKNIFKLVKENRGDLYD